MEWQTVQVVIQGPLKKRSFHFPEDVEVKKVDLFC